tara:strand:- start:834 stop:1832 length:999 start_codon:yes stop_codon:yes gene_type:complete
VQTVRCAYALFINLNRGDKHPIDPSGSQRALGFGCTLGFSDSQDRSTNTKQSHWVFNRYMQKIGRQTSFNQSVQAVLAAASHGKKSSHVIMRHHLEHLQKDLKLVNRLPMSIGNIQASHIKELTQYWGKKKYSPKTIYDKVSHIRKAVKLAGKILPKNSEMGIHYQAKQKKTFKITHTSTSVINDPAIKDICDLQLYFGLKKYEAMKISYFHDFYDRLLIDRKTAYNGKDRYILFINEFHRKNLLNIVNKYKPSQVVSPEQRLIMSKLHKQALNDLGINDEDYFRKLYMINRYRALCKSCMSRQVNLKKVSTEVGLSHIRKVAEVIQCLEIN